MKKRNKFFSDKARKELETVYNPEFICDMEDIFSNPFFKLSHKEQIDRDIKYGSKSRIGR